MLPTRPVIAATTAVVMIASAFVAGLAVIRGDSEPDEIADLDADIIDDEFIDGPFIAIEPLPATQPEPDTGAAESPDVVLPTGEVEAEVENNDRLYRVDELKHAPIVEPGAPTPEGLTIALVGALNAGKADVARQFAAAEPDMTLDRIEFLMEFAPFDVGMCFVVSTGATQCNAYTDMYGLTLSFTDDGQAITAVDGSYSDGL